MSIRSVNIPVLAAAVVLAPLLLNTLALPASAQVKDDTVTFAAPGLLEKKSDKKIPDVKAAPQAWPRLDPGSALCRTAEDLTRLTANRTHTAGGGPADCQIVHVATAVDVVQRQGAGRTQIRLTERPAVLGWTDVWLPEKAPLKR